MSITKWLVLVFLLGWNSTALATEVATQKTADGWQLLVEGKLFFIKGMSYSPTSIGESADDGTRRNWMIVDDDRDGRNDYAYQTWIDENKNNYRDPQEKEVGDFELMRQMGINTIRIYHHLSADPGLQKINAYSGKSSNYPPDFPPEKEKMLLRELHSQYGIWVAMGDLLGAYSVSSGASWDVGTDYTDPIQQANMLKSVEEMVRTHKDEPYILMWILGNENNLQEFTHTLASRQPEAYARFVNKATMLIKKIDPNHPVAICNGAYGLLEYYAKYAPAVDIFGLNFYSDNGFHEMWKNIASIYDRPVLLTEYGTGQPMVIDGKIDENVQTRIHLRAWEDIVRHSVGSEKPGNAIGGFVFQWVDEWWFDGNKWGQNINPKGDGWNHEYNGMFSLGSGSAGSLLRQPRKVYGAYQELWKKD
ncbi:MAG: Glycosyl hydrolases family 2, TIM barrel domain [Smithella sp. PtaU1.Bin162]|nr:MAG: Glycosyl hydrolases family 2, TIM barrel domain [Smithella sp. PtaU1.Bin162]